MLNSTGEVDCRGENFFGQLGDGCVSGPGGDCTDSLAFTRVSGLSGVTELAATSGTFCALTGSEVQCWGANFYEALGPNGSNSGASTPLSVPLASTPVELTAGTNHLCARLDTGAVQCWGRGGDYQLGDGNNPYSQPNPVTVAGIDGTAGSATWIAAGGDSTCAMLDTGTLMCWGDNTDGKLATGSTNNPETAPAAVQNVGGTVDTLAIGESHLCVLLQSGAIECAGANADGQLGDGGTMPSDVLVQAHDFDGSTDTATAVAVGRDHTCALRGAGDVLCWGSEANNALGHTGTMSSAPVVVTLP